MISVLAAAFAGSIPMVAVVARIYNPPGDNRLSRHEVYMCGIHGENRRKISRGNEDAVQVRWADRWHVEWATDVFPSWDRKVFRLYRYDLRTGQNKLIVEQTEWFDSEPVSGVMGPGVVFRSRDSRHPATFRISDDDMDEAIVTTGGRQIRFRLPNGIRGVEFESTTGRLWLYSWTHDSTTGSHWWVYLLNWKTGEPQLKIEDAGDMDFSKRRTLYAAVAPRDLAQYGKNRTVWVARAWVGDWKTGKSWTILDGLCEATSISIRPQK